jgi:hypothetical protein
MNEPNKKSKPRRSKKKNIVTTGEVRDFLVDYFEEKASFRQRMAERAMERKPWKTSYNEAHAESLRQMAKFVSDLPDDDPTLRALAECPPLYNKHSEMFEIPPSVDEPPSFADQSAVHCGPRGRVIESTEIGQWFADWAGDLIEEAPELRAQWKAKLLELDGGE